MCEILVPGPHMDKRFVQIAGEADYQQILDAGVTACAFQPSMLHTKVVTVDGAISAIGSANFNQRSTEYDDEVALVVCDAGLTATLDAHMDDDLRRSEKLDPERWKDRSLFQRLEEKAVQVIDGVL